MLTDANTLTREKTRTLMVRLATARMIGSRRGSGPETAATFLASDAGIGMLAECLTDPRVDRETMLVRVQDFLSQVGVSF